MSIPVDIDARVQVWTDAGLLTTEQASAIRTFEAAAAPANPAPTQVAEPASRDKVVALLGVLGGLLVGLGVLLSVAANWDSIGDTVKVVIIVVSMLAANFAGLLADRRGAPHWVGTTAYTVGLLVFAGGVFLLGQLFNVRAHDPLGFLIVAITGSCVAVVTARRMVGWIAAAAWLAWGVHEFVSWLGTAAENNAAAGEIIAASLLLGIAALAAGWVLDGIAAHAASTANDPAQRPFAADLDVLGAPMRGVALTGVLGLLLPLSFAWHLDAGDAEISTSGPIWIGLVIALAAAVALAVRGVLDHRRVTAAYLAIACVLAIMAAASTSGMFIGLAANVMLIGGGIGLAALGLTEDRRSEYAWGVVWIVAVVIVRYFDVMFSIALGGLGFIGAGLLLIGCAWMVRRSRTIWHARDEGAS